MIPLTCRPSLDDLKKLGSVSVEEGRAILCVVGEGLRSTPGIAARVFSTINDINVSLISQGASRINLTFAIEEARVREAVKRLHDEFFERELKVQSVRYALEREEQAESLNSELRACSSENYGRAAQSSTFRLRRLLGVRRLVGALARCDLSQHLYDGLEW